MINTYELSELVHYEQPYKYAVHSTKYDDRYKTPVLTAGKSFILGYTNETDGIFEDLPVIIFDDFTTSTQYVNFRFKVKSSAMKILKVNRNIALTKYMYYLMQTIRCDHDTHKRYWIQTYSKIKVSIPEKNEQQRIVEKIEELFSELDKGVEELNKVKEQLKIYRQAVLKEAFDGIDTKKTIKELSEIVTSGSRGWAKYYSDKGARFVRITDLTRDNIVLKNDAVQFVDLPENAEGKRSKLEPNDVLISITADLGSIAIVPADAGESYINQHIAMVRFKNKNQAKLYAWYLKSEYGQKDLLKNKRGAGKLGLGLDDIRYAKVPDINDETANEILFSIEQNLSVCDKIEQTVNESLKKAESLRQSILKNAFEGRL